MGYKFQVEAGKKEAGSRAALKTSISKTQGSLHCVCPLEETGILTVFSIWRLCAQETEAQGKELDKLGSHTTAQCRREKKIRALTKEKKGRLNV